MANTQYRRVRHCKKHNFIGGYSALWQADDHLLLVQNNIYAQSYKRFFFKDIQALNVKISNIWRIKTACLAVLLAFTVLFAMRSHGMERFVWLPPAGIFLLLSLINWYKGPSCQTTIVTRVQSHVLPVNRLKNAKKVCQYLADLIEKEQGRLQIAKVVEPLPLSRNQEQAPLQGKVKIKSLDYTYNGISHLLFFTLFLLAGGSVGLQFQSNNGAIMVGSVLIFLAGLIFLILALVRQNSSAMASSLKSNTWAALILVFVLIPLHYFEAMVHVVSSGVLDPESIQSALSILQSLATRNPTENGFFRFNLIFTTTTLAAVAIPGILQTVAFQKKRREVNGE